MDELVAQDKEMVLVNRSGLVDEVLPPHVQLMAVEANNPSAVAHVCANAETIFFCAQPPYHQWPKLFPPLMRSVLDGVAQTDGKLVFGSNLYMYGDTQGQALHEDLPYKAQTRKGLARAEIAQMLLDAHEQHRVQVTIGRGSDFYGPRVRQSLVGDLLFGAALRGQTVNLLGDIDLPHTLTYIGDFGRALVKLSEHEPAYGRAWHVPSAETISLRQFVTLVEQEIGQSIQSRSTGKVMLRLVGLFNPAARESIEMLYQFDQPFVVDHSRYADAFGEEVTSHEDAIAATVAWYREQAM